MVQTETSPLKTMEASYLDLSVAHPPELCLPATFNCMATLME
jgi:hypothetical protein